MNGVATGPRELDGRIRRSEAGATLFAPAMRYRSTNDSQFDPCMDWRADLLLGRLVSCAVNSFY
jgi:hypothetical protein